MLEPGLRIMLALVVGVGWYAFMRQLGMDQFNAFVAGVVFFVFVIYKTSPLVHRWYGAYFREPRYVVNVSTSPTPDVAMSDEPTSEVVRTWQRPPKQKGLMRFERPPRKSV